MLSPAGIPIEKDGGDQGLSRPDIPLQEAVHKLRGVHIGEAFPHRFLLVARQRIEKGADERADFMKIDGFGWR